MANGVLLIKKGRFKIKPQYDEVINVYIMGYKDLRVIIKNNRTGLIDSKGNILIDPNFESIEGGNLQFLGYVLLKSTDNKYGFLLDEE